MSNEVEVRIRAESATDAKRLCDWPADAMDRLIAELKLWGIYDGEEVRFGMSGEFRLLPAPHFEIVVHDTEDD